MVIKVQQLKKTSFDRILAFSAEGSDNRRSQDSSLLSILLEEMGLLDMVYILKRVWGKATRCRRCAIRPLNNSHLALCPSGAVPG